MLENIENQQKPLGIELERHATQPAGVISRSPNLGIICVCTGTSTVCAAPVQVPDTVVR
jgi:hypothetical protein